jgi:hypothetical protein
MAHAVYSKVFFQLANASGSYTWSVPGGDTAVLHAMSFWVRDDHPSSLVDSAVTVALDIEEVFVWDIKAPGALSGVYQWSGREVFTETLYLVVGLSAFSFRASGYLLTPT